MLGGAAGLAVPHNGSQPWKEAEESQGTTGSQILGGHHNGWLKSPGQSQNPRESRTPNGD